MLSDSVCIENITLDLYERLFNHRPFLKGEIKNFVKEFEEKRGDRDVESVFKVLETVTELNGGEIDKVKAQCDSTLPNLNARLLVANSMCTKILDQERSSEIVSILSLIKGDRSYFYQQSKFSKH